MKQLYKNLDSYKFYITVSLSILCAITTLISVGFGALNQDLNIAGDVEYTKDPGNTLRTWINNETTEFHSPEYEDLIITVEFLDNKNIPANAVANWDVSVIPNTGRVMAWIMEDSDNQGFYNLYIGADGKVLGNENSTSVFARMSKVETIRFNNNFDTKNVKYMDAMFVNCTALKNVDFNHLDTSNVISLHQTFSNCKSLEYIDLTDNDFANVGWLDGTFYSCISLKSIDISNKRFKEMTYFADTFDGCTSLEYANLSNLTVDNLGTFEPNFVGCNSLKKVDFSNFKAPSLTSVQPVFISANQLEEVDLSGFTAVNLTSMSSMFYNSPSLKTVNLSNINVPNVTTIDQLFYSCSSLENIDFTNFDTSNIKKMGGMFVRCMNLKKLDLRGFDTSQVTEMSNMFDSCNKLTEIRISSLWDISNVTSSVGMFHNCPQLPNFDSNYIDKAKAIPTTQGGYLTLDDGKLHNGDYFLMTPDSNTYTISTDASGYNEDQTINPSELTLWRVINVQNDGKVEAISEYTSSKQVNFSDDVAYTYLVNELQNIAAQYSKNNYTVSTRNFGYDGQTLIITNDYNTAPSQTTTPTPTTGTGTEYSSGLAGDTLYLKDYLLVMFVYGNLISNKVGTSTPSSYWVSSRYYEYEELTQSYEICGRIINTDGSIEHNNLAHFFGKGFHNVAMGSHYIRPIITLKSTIQTQSGAGTKSNPYTISN